MANLKYVYHCSDCKEDKYSYFADIPYCVYCNGTNIKVEDISHLNVDKFSEEGRKLIKFEDDFMKGRSRK